MDVVIVKVNLCYTNKSEAKTEFASKSSVSKKERKSYSSRIDNIGSIVDTSKICLGKIEIEVTSNWIITSSDIEILERWGKYT